MMFMREKRGHAIMNVSVAHAYEKVMTDYVKLTAKLGLNKAQSMAYAVTLAAERLQRKDGAKEAAAFAESYVATGNATRRSARKVNARRRKAKAGK